MPKNTNNRADRQERSSNNDIIGDRDFSIATSSVHSSVLKSTKFVADRAQARGDGQVSKTDKKGKVTIEESKSTPKDSTSREGQADLAAVTNSEPILFKKKTIRSSTLKNDDNHQVAQELSKK